MRALPLHRRFLPFFLPVLFSRGVGLSSLSVPSSPPFPSSEPAPRQSPAAGARPLPAGSGGVGAFRPRRVWPFADELVPLGDGEFIALSEFHCPGGKPGISTESLAFNFAEGGGLDVDTVKLLLAQQKQRWEAAFRQRRTLFPPSSTGARLGIVPIAAAKRDGAGGTLLSPRRVGKVRAFGQLGREGSAQTGQEESCGEVPLRFV